MTMFAPVYRPTKHQDPLPIREQRRQHKRKRGTDPVASDADDSDVEAQAQLGTTAFHPVNKTDPYHVAGHTREAPLPPAPFPHAAIRETKSTSRPIAEELAALNPPLYVLPNALSDAASTSVRRRHLDNLTTILHRCMLKGDWMRAYRAWSLLVRTEIAGRGIDVRQNGRWTIGAELLMRKGAENAARPPALPEVDESEDASVEGHANLNNVNANAFTEEGFRKARDYYERLIIQYPYTRSTMHTVNATAIYPALFNVWIYEVQWRSQNAENDMDERLSSYSLDGSDDSSEKSRMDIKENELQQALPIADRMDELLTSPPYDTNEKLKRLRRMVAAWIVDLQDELETKHEAGFTDERRRLEWQKASDGHSIGQLFSTV